MKKYFAWYRYVPTYSSEAVSPPELSTLQWWIKIPLHIYYTTSNPLPQALDQFFYRVARARQQVEYDCEDSGEIELLMQLSSRYYCLTDSDFNVIAFGNLGELDRHSIVARQIVIET